MTRLPLRTIIHPEMSGCRVLLHAHNIRGFNVPRGFVWNGCSHPAITRPLLGDPFEGPLRDGPLLHDYLYETRRVSRAQADELFHRQLIADGCNAAKAYAMWLAVRTFSASHYGPSARSMFVSAQQLATWEETQPISPLPLFSVAPSKPI